jgi:hypothetical protein
MASPNLSVGLFGDQVVNLHNALARAGIDAPASEVARKFFGPGTRQAVQLLQQKQALPITGEVDGATHAALGTGTAVVVVPPGSQPQSLPGSTGVVGGGTAPPRNQPPEGFGTYTVDGIVSCPDRAGIGGLRVELVDKNVGSDLPLVDTVTDDRGRYQVSFAPPVPALKKTQLDLQGRVYAGQAFLAASDVQYNATSHTTLNVNLPANLAQLPSEHETLTNAIAVHYLGKLGDLKESHDRQDITYLANKTGWDARAVALGALADQFSAQAKIPAEFFYALFRAGVPANEDVLYHADPATLKTIWSSAVDQGVMPKAGAGMIPEILKQFQSLSVQKLLNSPALTGASALKDMLAVAQLDATQQQQFATLYAANRTDMATFWKTVSDALGHDMANRLQVDGKLGFLTINNAPLMQQLHKESGANRLTDPLQLALAGYHRPAKWSGLLNANIPIPNEIPGDTTEQKRANYAEYLAAQVRLSYPTAAVAEMVKSGELPVNVPEQVHSFLTENQGKFEIGMQPVQQYIARNKLQVADETVTQVKRLQRLYQITPTDHAMSVLLNRGIDSGYHVARYDKQTFVQSFGQDFGGTDKALPVYNKALQVHNAVLNIAVSYLAAKNGIELGSSAMMVPRLGSNGSGQVLQPAPKGPAPENAADVIAYPTLEGLFGSMDFCACDHCRSVLSPAAYLVDLLHFMDQTPIEMGKKNPQAVLLERRPDIQNLPLTCENTNTALPYIDVVNETIEYYVANGVQPLSLKGYLGHDTGGAASEDLLASPQFVMDAAYTVLRGERFPTPLPFHQPLESLRRYLEKFGVPLTLAMERLRKSDELERGGNPYGWRDILMEELLISRAEYDLLTNGTLTLQRIYGFASGKSEVETIAELSNAKKFARRIQITYEDIASLLKTRFINPNSDLVPKLERLGVSFATLQALHDGTITDVAFKAMLPQGAGAPDPVEYGGDIVAWVKQTDNYARIMGLITLSDPDPTKSADPCNFDVLEFRYAKPIPKAGDTSTRLGTVEFVRLLRFILLWKKTGWTIEETDAAICALFPVPPFPLGADAINTVPKLDAGFVNLTPRLGIVLRVMNALSLVSTRDLLPLLACWSDLSTHGDNALYRKMFLNPAVLQRDPVFSDNGYGEFLQNVPDKLEAHAETLRAAFNLTAEEFERILAELKYDSNTSLTIADISTIYRRGWLARKLRLSVRELLLLISLTGWDPFTGPDFPSAASPAIMRLIALVETLKTRSLKSAVALYLIWNQDLSGKSAPPAAQVIEFARTLRADFASIEDQFAATEDPGGDVARTRMTLVYGQEAADAFFALLDDTLVSDVVYTHGQPTLESSIMAADPEIAYDDFRHRLSHTGLLSTTKRDALKAVAQVTQAFKAAVDALFARSQDAGGSFFARYPELKPLYDTYIASPDPPVKKRAALLAAFRPELSRRRKRQQAVQRLSAAAGVDLAFTQALLDLASAPYPLHAVGHTDQPALNDVLALETPGLAAQFFFRDTATAPVDLTAEAVANLDYASGGDNPLPSNTTPGAAISGIWRGQLETPEAGFYNIVIEADTGASVTLHLEGQTRRLTQNGTIWRNTDPLELKAGTVYEISLTVEKIKDTLGVKWETPKRPREVIPGRYLYPPTILAPFSETYIRFLKVTSLATGLLLTANEMVRFAIDVDYQIAGDGWLNALPVSGDPPSATAVALAKPFQALLDFARIKADLSPGDEQLLTILRDPTTATTNADSLLFILTRWEKTSLSDVLTQFGGNIASLAHVDLFRRVYDAFALIQTMGIAASALIKATTNDPDGGTVRDLQAALRARYDAADWRVVIQPINNEMRGLQRDALVAYILHQMGEDPTRAQIDTADKLFEYFLMDVEMDPCMQTSRIRHALSSVQLFIERCLMNLEPDVSPSSINAQRWLWMKRYRVWEANRKVFLFPENWLEPELRDDKSPFFKEIESELLQSDITDDSATTALLNYLSKLADVAKLETCGIYRVAGDPHQQTGDVDHVIARSTGAHRKYYYRRREFGYWTPWEQVKLDIDDNPVIPVIWNNRLLLFWLRIMKRGPDTAQAPAADPPQELVKLQTSDLPTGDPPVIVGVILCWSEYYNGKWQGVKTSDVHNPANLGAFSAQGQNAFDRSQLSLWVFQDGETLWAFARYASTSTGFHLYNTHSLPVIEGQPDTRPFFFPANEIRELNRGNTHGGSGDFTNDYYNLSSGGLTPVERTILKPAIQFNITDEPSYQLQYPFDTPFFFEDRRHVFYVTTTEQPSFIGGYTNYGFTVNASGRQFAQIPPLVLQEEPPREIGPKFVPVGPGPGVVDPGPMRRFVTQDAYIRRGIGTSGFVKYGDRQIGPAGAIAEMPAMK